MRGIQRHTFSSDALHQVRLQPFLQHPEPGATADIRSKRHTHARIKVAPQRKDPAAEGSVARRTMRDRRCGYREAVKLTVRREDIVRKHRARSRELETVVD